jgi:hypothetical protein
MHAKHVRTLNCEIQTPQGVYFSETFIKSLHALSHTMSPFPLLPAVKSLAWAANTPAQLKSMCYLLSWRIEELSLRITISETMSAFDELVETLAVVGASISLLNLNLDFDFRANGGVGLFGVSALPIFAFCPNITRLSLQSQVFTHILPEIFPSLTKLVHLELNGQRSNELIPDRTVSVITSHSHSLTLRKIDGDRITLWISLLPLTSGTMDSIIIYHHSLRTTHTELRQFVDIVGATCPHLQVLILRDLRFNADSVHLKNILRPLLRCKQLKELTIGCADGASFDFCYALSDQDIIEMAKAWNELICLGINQGTKRRQTKPPLTLNAIASLKTHCPRIDYVGLTVDAAVQPQDAVSLLHIPLESTYPSIEFGHSWIYKPSDLAAWLEPRFPCMDWFEWDDNPRRSQMFQDTQDFLWELGVVVEAHDNDKKLLKATQKTEMDSLRDEVRKLKEMLAQDVVER